jgi:hypothetical protein
MVTTIPHTKPKLESDAPYFKDSPAMQPKEYYQKILEGFDTSTDKDDKDNNDNNNREREQ